MIIENKVFYTFIFKDIKVDDLICIIDSLFYT